MSKDTELVLDRLPESHLPEIRPLFSRVFGHDISTDLLEWKYAQGRGQSWVARVAGKPDPLVHCGVFFRDVLFEGGVFRAGQLVDLMAAPKGFGLTRKGSPFALLLKHILEQLPNEKNPEGIAFGVPSGRSMRLAEHCGVATEADRWLELCLLPVRIPRVPRLRDWRTSDVSVAKIAWTRMASSLSNAAIGVRDISYLEYRYLRHPEHSYLVLEAVSTWLRRPMGLIVMRRHPHHFELVDLLAAWEDMPEILLAVQNWLALSCGDTAVMSLTESFARQLAPYANSCRTTQFRIMGNPLCSPDTLRRLCNRWWLTGGDTDYR